MIYKKKKKKKTKKKRSTLVRNQNQNSLLVKRQTDNTTSGGWGLTGGLPTTSQLRYNMFSSSGDDFCRVVWRSTWPFDPGSFFTVY